MKDKTKKYGTAKIGAPLKWGEETKSLQIRTPISEIGNVRRLVTDYLTAKFKNKTNGSLQNRKQRKD